MLKIIPWYNVMSPLLMLYTHILYTVLIVKGFC